MKNVGNRATYYGYKKEFLMLLCKNMANQVLYNGSATTHVDVDPPVVVEDGDLGVVRRDEPVELLLVVVPLDRVESVPLHVVVAPHHRLLAPQRVRGDHGVLQEADRRTTCRGGGEKGRVKNT